MPLNTSSTLIYQAKILSKFVLVQLCVQVLGLANGILLVRALDQQQYAYFTIANTMQGTMNILADSGISSAITSVGGKLWQDRYRFGQLINTAMLLRRYFALIAVVVVTPLLIWMLVGNGSSIVYAVFITVGVLVGLNFQLTASVLGVVPRLHSQLNRIQNIDLIAAFSRLIFLVVALFIFLDAGVAIYIASIVFALQHFVLNRWVGDNIDQKAPVNEEDKAAILKIVKPQTPNAIFYCVQGQLNIWLIGLFGNTQNIAEFGALGRLAVIFSVFSAVMSGIVLPSFARCQSVNILSRRYWQIIGGFCVFGLMLVSLAVFFPTQVLWILGNQYQHLESEVVLMVASTVLSSLAGIMWSINSAKAWIEYVWIEPPLRIILQIILLMSLDISTVKGVLIFNILSAASPVFVNAFLTYKGFSSYKTIKMPDISNF
jgi:O-antigen/teichoic acid export membrane protein